MLSISQVQQQSISLSLEQPGIFTLIIICVFIGFAGSPWTVISYYNKHHYNTYFLSINSIFSLEPKIWQFHHSLQIPRIENCI